MKGLKLVAVTMLTVGAVFGSVIERAEAQFMSTGNKGTWGRDREELSFELGFELFPTAIDTDSKQRKGSFSNVVTNFTADFFSDGLNSFFFSNNNSGGLWIDEPLTLSLNTVLSGGSIEYILSSDELKDKGITEITLILSEGRGDSAAEELLDFSTIDSLNKSKERRKAVNSLEYIISNELLGLVNEIRVSGPSFSDPESIVSFSYSIFQSASNVEPITKTFPESSPNDNLLMVSLDASLDDEFVKTIPESNPSSSLLALGALGVGLGVKRRFQAK